MFPTQPWRKQEQHTMVSKIWRSNIFFSTRLKLRLFRSNVKSVLLHECSIILRRSPAQSFKPLLTGVFASSLGFLNRISAAELYRRTDQESINKKVPVDCAILMENTQCNGILLLAEKWVALSKCGAERLRKNPECWKWVKESWQVSLTSWKLLRMEDDANGSQIGANNT